MDGHGHLFGQTGQGEIIPVRYDIPLEMPDLMDEIHHMGHPDLLDGSGN